MSRQDTETATGWSAGPIAAVAVLAVLVLAAFVLLHGTDNGADSSGTAASPAPAATSGSGSAGAGDSCQGVAPASRQLPKAPPADLRMEVENSALIPVSDTYGPRDRSGPVWRCFSHSPLGAVMAAKTISTRRVASLDRVKVGQEQLVENVGKQIYLKAVRAKGDDTLRAQPGTFAQPAGFRIDSYTGDTAVISSVTRAKDGSLRASSLTVLWQDGDWRLQLLPDGGDTAALTRISTLEGYIVWGL